MMEKPRTFDNVAMVSFVILTPLFLTLPCALVSESGAFAWAVPLLSAVLALPVFLSVQPLLKRHKDMTLTEIVTFVLGRPIGLLYKALLAVYFSLFSGQIVRETAQLLRAFGFKNTPLYLSCIFLVIVPVLMALMGAKGLFKTVSLFFALLIIGFLCAFLVGLNRYDITNLSVSPSSTLLKSALIHTPLFGGLILLFLYPQTRKRAKKSGIIALCLSAAIGAIFLICYVMMFSTSIAKLLPFGYMEMGKAGYYNHFFYRFESFFMVFVLISAIISTAIGIFSAAGGEKSSRAGIVICGIFTLAAALVPLDLQPAFTVGATAVFALPLVTMIVSFFKTKKVVT